MKHKCFLCLAMFALVCTFGSLSWSQSDSLADYARATRKDKKSTAKQYDNDNLPRQDKLSVVGNAPADSDAQTSDKPADANSDPQTAQAENNQGSQPNPDAAKNPDSGSGSDAEQRQKEMDEWKKKIDSQKEQVDLLTRELDVMQREYKLRAAAFYADAGNRLRNSGSWDKEDSQYKQQIAEKQKAVDQAKQSLEDLQEKARKAGVPAKNRE
jgi:hypothetical protein